MNLINIKVDHKVFGEGVIIENENSYVTVKFKNDEKKFMYPSSFDGYLTVQSIKADESIKEEIRAIKKLEKDEKLRLAEVERKIKVEKLNNSKKAKAKVYPRANIAFKCTFSDEGYSNEKELTSIVQTFNRNGESMKLNKVKNNSLCIVTTREPNTVERERYIFGVFLVDESYNRDNKDEGYVTTNSKYSIKLSLEESHKMLFWNYHTNANKPELALWSSGLHRYFEDEQAIQILQDIVALKKGTDEEELSKEFLLHFAKINNININTVAEKNGVLQNILIPKVAIDCK
ncbi:hypothetical protein H9660_06490 [Clostridium sp. Sa3CUN1]|uniref:Uncharacterized protein n=1 Tax=Clostridium gallinarum TaxID=2762246 RepID=A0ABR8Q304_9CLOT|nr:hypothetical protein [Clostridium gallinarum]MBD7914790.1 hypothetical protein [Clostridium gallinarum]